MLFVMFGDDKENVNKEVLKLIKHENIMWDTKFESQAASTLINLKQKLNIYEATQRTQAVGIAPMKNIGVHVVVLGVMAWIYGRFGN